MLALMLEDAGIEITQACSAEEALRITDELDLPFDMVLTDVVLPKMNGRQLADAMRAQQPDLRVLLFIMGIALATGIGFGLAPAIRGSRTRSGGTAVSPMPISSP